MKYIAFFDTLDYANEKRSIGLSSVNVVDYMAETIGELEKVDLISPTRTLLPRGYLKGRDISISENVCLHQPPTWGTSLKLGRLLVLAYTQLWLMLYILKTAKRGETIVSYHSLSTMKTTKWLKKIKGLRLILEIREIYTDINESTEKQKKDELAFFQCADGYIFPTELLNKKINQNHKPYVIATGIYKREAKLSEKFNDGKVHVVYAGTFRKAKGGAVMAVKIAEFLDERYHVHILGEGGAETTKLVTDEIERVSKISGATVTYDGVLRGDEFKAFLQKCHIGLSTQTPEGNYNDSSFPSKILTYMVNGLSVLSIRIPAVESSPVGKYVYYYDKDDPRGAAEQLVKIPKNSSVDKENVLDELQKKLTCDLSGLLLI